jgi:RHS repeat-associated protein
MAREGTAGRFRTPCPGRCRSHLPAPQPSRRNRPTCSEGPFGELIRATGPMARACPFRWSTQYQDDETDLVIYPARVYNASTGRWLSRDPAEEDGGRNLYGFVGNDPIGAVDPFGFVKVDFAVTRGVLYWIPIVGRWGGEWGSPAKFATGAYRIGLFSADSLVHIASPPVGGKYAGACNTVWDTWSLENRIAHGGEIRAFVWDLCPGKYDVTIDYSVHLWVTGGKGEATAVVYGPDSQVAWRGRGTPGSDGWAVHERKTFRIVVGSKHQKILVADYVPTLEGTNSKTNRVLHGWATLFLYPDQIKEVR